MRYNCYGRTADAFDSNEMLDPESLPEFHVVYSTDTPDEAKALLAAGGYMKNDQWVVIQWIEDTETQGIMGNKPHSTEAYKATQTKALNKKNYL